jgi:hypothetical protein
LDRLTKGIAVHETGTIWAVGASSLQNNNRIWAVRRGTPTISGFVWEDVDPYSFDSAELSKRDKMISARAMTVAIRPVSSGIPDIYVGGWAATEREGYLWVVRRSRDGGTTWTTVDRFATGGGGVPVDLAVSPTVGSIYVVGRIYEKLTRKTGQYVSLVRRGVTTSTGGIAWTDVDRVIGNFTLRAVGARGVPVRAGLLLPKGSIDDEAATPIAHEDPSAQNQGRSDRDRDRLTGTAAVVGL